MRIYFLEKRVQNANLFSPGAFKTQLHRRVRRAGRASKMLGAKGSLTPQCDSKKSKKKIRMVKNKTYVN